MALTPEDIAQIQTLLSESMKTLPLGDIVKSQLASALSPLQAEIEAMKVAPKVEVQDNKDANPLADEVRALREQVMARENALKDAAALSNKERLRNATKDALLKNGVPADRINVAMSFIEPQVANQNDIYGIKGKDQWGVESHIPLDQAIPTFLATPEGKLFVPPSNVGGTGNTVGQPARTQAGGIDWTSLANTAMNNVVTKSQL